MEKAPSVSRRVCRLQRIVNILAHMSQGASEQVASEHTSKKGCVHKAEPARGQQDQQGQQYGDRERECRVCKRVIRRMGHNGAPVMPVAVEKVRTKGKVRAVIPGPCGESETMDGQTGSRRTADSLHKGRESSLGPGEQGRRDWALVETTATGHLHSGSHCTLAYLALELLVRCTAWLGANK